MTSINPIETSLWAFSTIENAYFDKFDNNNLKTPSEKDIQQMNASLALMNLSGKLVTASGVIGLGVTYIVWSAPYVGPLVGIIGGVASLAAGVFGYDAYVASKDLQIYAESTYTTISGARQSTLSEFRKKLVYTAGKNTLLIGAIYNYYFANMTIFEKKV